MKLIAYLIATLALVCSVLAVDQQISVLVTYPDDTADHIVDEAKQAIVDAGGIITHEYNLIKGFAAIAGEKIVETVKGMGSQTLARIEEDRKVSI